MGDWGPLEGVLAGASDRNRANLKDLVAHAKNLLKLVRETFPRYTMHDEQHAENVIRLIGKLAGPRLEAMTGLEAALLILAAYFHDAGMAYSADELRQITDEDEFRAFLEQHDEAYLATERNGGKPTEAVVEQYCRSRHADRVRVHLERCDRALLQWDGVSIIEPLAMVCRSHNEPAVALHEPRFRTDYLYAADLRFCAVMLRLADILDLDDTRAPRVVYDHLTLARRSTAEAATSDREWNKHLAARGFLFPPTPTANYVLQFIADPTSPGVEHDLRTFLAVIQDELLQCRSVADVCSDRWRGLPLPAEIDMSGITSHGYRYGEFRFELDRAAVLELFTGERLYNDAYAFVRELLQNALDAVGARKHLFGHESTGIRVWCWEDEDGHTWIRVDDDGIGMDEEALRKYFLRVGTSYYRSAEFEAELSRRGLARQPFGTISRFGIGVLSCLMVADRIELSSRREGRGAVRLSINRQDDYFVLQEPGMQSREMPGRAGPEPAFGSRPGTRIAVRIDPDRTGIYPDLVRERIASFVLTPPVPVLVNDHEVSGPAPVDPGLHVVEVDAAELRQAGRALDAYLGRLRLAALSISLSAVAEVPDVQGEVVAYVVLPPADRNDAWVFPPDPARGDLSGLVKRSAKTFQATLTRRPGSSAEAVIDIRRTIRVNRGDLAPKSRRSPAYGRDRARGSQLSFSSRVFAPIAELIHDPAHRRLDSRVGYHGIALPAGDDLIAFSSDRELRGGGIVRGSISLSADLRPDLDVSRSKIVGVPFAVHSAVHLAVRRASQALTDVPAELYAVWRALTDAEFMAATPPAELFTAAALENDPLLRGGAWNSEALIVTEGGAVSIEALRASGAGVVVRTTPAGSWGENGRFRFYPVAATALLHFFTSLEWTPEDGRLRVASADLPRHRPGASRFPPLFAVPYRSESTLARAGTGSLNAGHPLAGWLLENADVLAATFPAPFEQTLRPLRSVGSINTALDRVARSRPDLAPPPGAYLRQDDKGWWWSR